MGKSQRRIFGIDFCTLRRPDLVRECLMDSPQGTGVRLLVTANLDHIVNLLRNARFRWAYSNAWRATIDGMPVYLYAHLRGSAVPERVTGADLFFDIVQGLDPDRHSVFFVAPKQHTLDALLAEMVRRGFSIDNSGGEVPPFGFESDSVYSEALCARIRTLGTTHLFFGVGAPKSEIWVEEHRLRLGDLYAFGFGAALDFYAGVIRRAPRFMQRMGLEWLWRLASEPRRLFRRYLVNSWFFLLAIWRDIASGGEAMRR